MADFPTAAQSAVLAANSAKGAANSASTAAANAQKAAVSAHDAQVAAGSIGNVVKTVAPGSGISVDSSDPAHPIVSASGGVVSVQSGTNVSVDSSDPANPIVNVPAFGVQTIVPGTNVTVDNTDPLNPIVSASGGGGGGGVQTIAPGSNITVDNTDPANPIVAVSATATPTANKIPISESSHQQLNDGWTHNTPLFLTSPAPQVFTIENIYSIGAWTVPRLGLEKNGSTQFYFNLSCLITGPDSTSVGFRVKVNGQNSQFFGENISGTDEQIFFEFGDYVSRGDIGALGTGTSGLFNNAAATIELFVTIGSGDGSTPIAPVTVRGVSMTVGGDVETPAWHY